VKLIIKREDLVLDINIEDFVKNNLLYKETPDALIKLAISCFLDALDDEYYYNITENQKESIFKEVKQYIKNMEDYTLLDICKRLVNNNDLRVSNGHYTSVDAKPLLEYIIKKEEKLRKELLDNKCNKVVDIKGIDAYDKNNVIKGFLDDYEMPDPTKNEMVDK